eukprot:scaffold57479_cov19-Tisochrysis_lutea.AAC.2
MPFLIDCDRIKKETEGAEIADKGYMLPECFQNGGCLFDPPKHKKLTRNVQLACSGCRHTSILAACLCLAPGDVMRWSLTPGASTEAREAAAEGLGEMVALTSQDALRPFVVQITGPLIRIIGDRFPSQVPVCI